MVSEIAEQLGIAGYRAECATPLNTGSNATCQWKSKNMFPTESLAGATLDEHIASAHPNNPNAYGYVLPVARDVLEHSAPLD